LKYLNTSQHWSLEVVSRSRLPLRLTLNISETVRDRGLVPKDYQ